MTAASNPAAAQIPPRLIKDYDIPDDQVVARIRTARMVSPTKRHVDIPIDNCYVGMVDREHFDEFLRVRAADTGAERVTGTYTKITVTPAAPMFITATKKAARPVQ